jgi:hypothetical protein
VIDDLLAELTAAGEVQSEGEFTLDRAKARDKLRRFQLADPRAYVLELVQAASLKGATWVTFTVDSRDMVMELDGRPFTLADFDDIYGAALTRRLDPDVLARRQLAIGLGSAMALRPRVVTVESGDGTRGARLVLRPEREDELAPIETARVGTRIHVRERFAMSTFAAFFKNLAGTLAEEQLLRARCGYASFGIGLEGARLDRGLSLDDEPMLDVMEATGEHTRALCGLREDGAGPARMRIIKDGVWIADHELPSPQFPPGLRVVVQDHAVRKDVSQSDIVRDGAYEAMLAVVRRGSWRAVAALAERVLGGAVWSWAIPVLVWQLDEVSRVDELVREVDEPTGIVRALRRLPLWRTTAGESLCLDAVLREAAGGGSIGYTRKRGLEGLALPGRSFVVYLPAPAAAPDEPVGLPRGILARVLGPRLHDVTEGLEALQRREAAQRAWKLRPTPPVLPDGEYLARRTFAAPGVQGELGIVAAQVDRATVAWVVEGCLLAEQRVELPWLGLRIVVAADGVRPDASLERVEPTTRACTALLHAVLGLPALYGALAQAPASAWRDACAMSFLESALRGDSRAIVLDHLGPPPTARRCALQAFEGVPLELDAGVTDAAPHPTAHMPLLRTVGAGRVSLHELVERSRRGERILAVAEGERGIEADILVLDADERALLQPRIAQPIGDGTAEVHRLRCQRVFLSKPPGPPVLDGFPPAVLVPIEGEGITGMLRLLPRRGVARVPLTVLHQQRAIDRLPLYLAGHGSGWVESTAVVPNPDYRGVRDGEALDQVRAAVLRAYGAACLKLAARCGEQPTNDEAAFFRDVLGLAFPGALRPAYEALRAAKEVTTAQLGELYRRMYAAVHLESATAGLMTRLRQLAGSRTPVARAKALRVPARAHGWAVAAVDVLFPAGDDPYDLERRVLRPAAPLDALPLFRHHDGRPLTLAAIRDVLEHEPVLLYTEALVPFDVPEHTVVRVDAEESELLRRVVGSPRVVDGSVVMAQLRRRHELAERPKVEHVALAPGAALVSVRIEPRKRAKGGVEGEVGLVAHHPGDPLRSPRLRLATHVERAPLELVELDDRPAWLVAAITDDRLQLTPDHDGVAQDRAFHAVVRRCEHRWPALLRRLLAAWPELPSSARRSAWYHVLDFLVAHRPPGLEAWDRPGAIDEVLAAAAAVPGFSTAGGKPCSLLPLVSAYLRHDRLDVLPAPSEVWGASPLPPDRPVVCVDAYELGALRRLLPRVESVEASWAQWQARARRQRVAPAARMLPDDALLVRHELDEGTLRGVLAIPVAGHPLTIELCAEGRVIAARSLSGVLPCWGSVEGPGVQPDDEWADAIVHGFALKVLRRGSHALYAELARWFLGHDDHPEHARVASLLAERVVALRRAERVGALPKPQAELLDALRPARVLALPNGRRLSLDTALQEQPGPLAHLDLWDAASHRLPRRYGDAPAPSPASGASEPPRPAPSQARLLDALRAELGLVRRHNERLLADTHLDRIHVRSLGGGGERAPVVRIERQGVIVNRDHPVVARALAELDTDPVWGSYVASAVYTALNVQLAEITDADERTFLELHASLVAGR